MTNITRTCEVCGSLYVFDTDPKNSPQLFEVCCSECGTLASIRHMVHLTKGAADRAYDKARIVEMDLDSSRGQARADRASLSLCLLLLSFLSVVQFIIILFMMNDLHTVLNLIRPVLEK